MQASTKNNIEKRGRGRPRKDSAPQLVRLPADMFDAIDRWSEAQPDKPGRAEAIRRLLGAALGRASSREAMSGNAKAALKKAAPAKPR